MSFGREHALRAPELLVEAADGRAAIAGDVARGIQLGAPVALLLHEREADDSLRAGHEDPVLGQIVFVVETDFLQRHRLLPRRVGVNPALAALHGKLA